MVKKDTVTLFLPTFDPGTAAFCFNFSLTSNPPEKLPIWMDGNRLLFSDFASWLATLSKQALIDGVLTVGDGGGDEGESEPKPAGIVLAASWNSSI